MTKGVWERSGFEVESVIFAVLGRLSYLSFRLGGREKDRRASSFRGDVYSRIAYSSSRYRGVQIVRMGRVLGFCRGYDGALRWGNGF